MRCKHWRFFALCFVGFLLATISLLAGSAVQAQETLTTIIDIERDPSLFTANSNQTSVTYSGNLTDSDNGFSADFIESFLGPITEPIGTGFHTNVKRDFNALSLQFLANEGTFRLFEFNGGFGDGGFDLNLTEQNDALASGFFQTREDNTDVDIILSNVQETDLITIDVLAIQGSSRGMTFEVQGSGQPAVTSAAVLDEEQLDLGDNGNAFERIATDLTGATSYTIDTSVPDTTPENDIGNITAIRVTRVCVADCVTVPPGDINGDFVTNSDDFDILTQNMFQDVVATEGLTLRQQGDLDGDGTVGILDFRIYKNDPTLDFDAPSPLIAAVSASNAVPEPASLALLVLGGGLLAHGGRRQQRSC